MSQEDPTPRSGSHPALQLLLARARNHRPVMEAGLDRDSLQGASKPEALPGRVEGHRWEAPDKAPNDLAAQRWGVIAPEGREGEALLSAISPLIALRQEEQGGAEVERFHVPPDQDAKAALKWRNEVLRALPTEERPKYLLLLGDLRHVSMELQSVLSHSNYVGRLHVGNAHGEPDLEGYAAYAEKVVADAKRTELDEAPEMLLYTAQDGSEPTRMAQTLLVEPCLEEMEVAWKKKRPALGIRLLTPGGANLETFLRGAGAARSGVMLSAAHGIGRPENGWTSPEEQRALQGSLLLSPDELLTRDMVRETPFLPGGIWLSIACFGAATPRKSVFHPWLSALANAGVASADPQAALKSLPQPGDQPFVAALPQALLANPRGPLAVISHCDLAWVFSFVDVEDPSGTRASQPSKPSKRASRILSALKVLTNGSRVGVALDTLLGFYREVNDQLTQEYEDSEGGPAPSRDQQVRRGYLWMTRNDLRGYMLLGDPAARLAVKRDEP